MSIRITFIVPTFNEEKNIVKCLNSINKKINSQILVIDSCSTDQTVSISEGLGAKVYQGKWDTFSQKINWAINNTSIETEWVMRIDADEVLTDNFCRYLNNVNPNDLKSDAYAVKRRFEFLGHLMKFGGYNSLWDIRLWKKGAVQMENRTIDEHMVVNGFLERMNYEIIDSNNKSISEWIIKHDRFSTREALSAGNSEEIHGVSDRSAKLKRFLKNNLYYKLPLLSRGFIFFIYRYFVLLGFLDGKAGLIIHVLHSFWYRFLVDVKIYESKMK